MKIKLLHLSKFTFCMGLASVLALPATADVLLGWETGLGFVSPNNDEENWYWAVDATASDSNLELTSASLTPGEGILSHPGGGDDWNTTKLRFFNSESYTAGNGTIGVAKTEGDYFEFTLTPDAGYKVSVDSLTIFGSTSSGAVTLELFSDHNGDNFATSLDIKSTTDADTDIVWDIPALTPHQNLTSAVTFRLYGYSTSAPNGHTVNIGTRVGPEIILSGTVAVIPEPSSLLLLGIAGGLVMLFRRRG